MATIVIDAGHGGSDWGATRDNRMEKADVLGLSVAIGRELTRRGHRVIYTRQSDVFVPLVERARLSNNSNADLFVSIHRNSHTTETANGFENIVRPNASARETACATSVLNRVNALGVFSNRGLKTGNFVVLTATQAPAMLIEYGFISNNNDNQRFDQNFDRLVTATVDGIEDCIGSGSGVTPPPSGGSLQGTISTSGGNLNVRSAPNNGAGVIGSLPNGSNVSILGEQNGWYRINFNGQTGWINGSFVRASGNGTVSTTSGNLNMRANPTTSSPVIGSIPNGTRLNISGISGNFFRTTFGGNTGWVSRDFVRL